MKKQLLWGAALLLCGLTACKKSDFGSNQANASKTIKTDVTSPNYVELQPYPNVPGTYFATYGQAQLVISGLYYDTRQYPTFKEGIPAFGSVSIPGPDNIHSVATEEGYSTGKSFVVTTTYQSVTNYQAIHNDLVRYYKAVDQWVADMPADTFPPIMRDYIKSSYTIGDSRVITTSGKLITITTGSKWAIATGDYKIPKPISVEHILGGIVDPLNPNITYTLRGVNGQITKVDSYAQSATGTYFPTSDPVINTVTVTIKRTNGTTFQVTQQNTIDVT